MVRGEFSHRTLHGAPSARRKLFFATIIVLLIFGVDFVSGGFIRNMVRNSAASIWNASVHIRSSVAGSGFFSSKKGLAEENIALREQLNQMQERAAAYAVLASENAELRGLLNVASQERGITAPVVSSFRASPYGTFLIAAGGGDVSIGAYVVTEGGFVVGRVSEVGNRTSVVRGIFAADNEVEAIVSGEALVVEGQGGGNARTEAPRGIPIQVGDPVIVPTLGGRPIGVVGRVESDASGSSSKVLIQLPVNLSALRYVYIINI